MPSCQQHPSVQSDAQPEIGQSYVYALPTRCGSRMKIGRSIDPFGRIAGLIRNHPEIDLDRAAIIGVDSMSMELVLHTVFAWRRNPLSQRTDGYTEWFDGDFVDQVISLCRTVAEYRGSSVSVTQNLTVGLGAYLEKNPARRLAVSGLSKVEREARAQVLMERLSELVVDRAHHFVDVMGERSLAHVHGHAGQHYLARDFNVAGELMGSRTTAWAARLSSAAQVSVTVDGYRALFHLAKSPIYQQIDESTFREYFRIPQGPHDLPLHGAADVSGKAFEILWAAVQRLVEISDGRVE